MKGEAKALEKWGSIRGLFLRSQNGVVHLGGGSPPGKDGDECMLVLAVLPGYKPVFPTPHPPHLEALALETSEPRQPLQKLGTRSQLSWPVGRGHEGEGSGRG